MQNVTGSTSQAESKKNELTHLSLSPIENEQQKKDLSGSISKMNRVKEEVQRIHGTISSEYNTLNVRLNALVEKKIIAKSNEISETDKSIQDYLQLLTLIEKEVDAEITTLNTILTNDGSQTIALGKGEPTTMDALIAFKLKATRLQAKEIDSSLKISYSRYQHWLTRSRLNLDSIELRTR